MASGASSAAAAGVAVMGMAARPAAVTAAARDRKVRRFNIRNSPRFDGLRRRSVPKRGSARDREAESRVQAAPGKRKAPARLERRDLFPLALAGIYIAPRKLSLKMALSEN